MSRLPYGFSLASRLPYIWNTPHAPFMYSKDKECIAFTHSSFHFFFFAAQTIRLSDQQFGITKNGQLYTTGVIEIWMTSSQQWMTPCAQGITDQSARVMCRMGGYTGGEGGSGRWDGGHMLRKDSMWKKYLFCKGNEQRVQDCVMKDYPECSTPPMGVKCYLG